MYIMYMIHNFEEFRLMKFLGFVIYIANSFGSYSFAILYAFYTFLSKTFTNLSKFSFVWSGVTHNLNLLCPKLTAGN